MPDFAREPLSAAVQVAADDQPCADPGVGLDVDQLIGGAPMQVVLAARHHVGVVVDDRDAGEPLAQPLGDREPVPSRHGRGVDRPAAGEVDRCRQADADAPNPAWVKARALAQRIQPVGHRLKGGQRSGLDLVIDAVGDEKPAREVGDRHMCARLAQACGEHDAGGRVEREPRRGATTGRTRVAHPGHDAGAQQSFEMLSDPRARPSRALHQLRSRPTAQVAQQSQQFRVTRLDRHRDARARHCAELLTRRERL